MLTRTSLMPWRGRFGLRHGRREEDYPMEVFRREFDRLFDDFWRGFELPSFGRMDYPLGMMAPRMDVTEEDDEFLVTMELPGMDEKDVEVELSDNVLTIKGEKKAEEHEAGKGRTYMERSYGSFRRSIPLDLEVVTEKVEARFDKGVLTVVLPKTPEAKKETRKIPIGVGAKAEKLEKKAA